MLKRLGYIIVCIIYMASVMMSNLPVLGENVLNLVDKKEIVSREMQGMWDMMSKHVGSNKSFLYKKDDNNLGRKRDVLTEVGNIDDKEETIEDTTSKSRQDFVMREIESLYNNNSMNVSDHGVQKVEEIEVTKSKINFSDILPKKLDAYGKGFENIMRKHGYKFVGKWGKMIGEIENNRWIGTGNLNLAEFRARIERPVLLKSKNNVKSKFAYVSLDTGIYIDMGTGSDKLLEAPSLESPELAKRIFNFEPDTVVFVGNRKNRVELKDDKGDKEYAKIYIPVVNLNVGDKVNVYYSNDTVDWVFMLNTGVVDIDGGLYVVFESDHFTYFAVGVNEGSFLINNGDLSTNTVNVVLNNNMVNMSGMKFSNNSGDLLSLAWEPYSSTKNWILTSGAGTKTVYAMFQDSLGNTGIVSDSIILDTAQTDVNWIDYSVLPTTDKLALWFDADDFSTVVFSTGNAVSKIQDKTENRYDALQMSSANQPLLVDGVIREKPALSFDGADDYLAVSGLYYDDASTLSGVFVCTVFRTNFVGSSYNDNRSFLDFDRSDFFNFYIRGDDGRIGFSFYGGSIIDNYGTASYNDDKPHIACISYNSSDIDDTKIIVDGNVELSQDNLALGQYLGKTTTRYGFLGDGSEASTFDGNRNGKYYDGYLAEMVYYERSIDVSEQNAIQCYLSNKRGIDLSISCDTVAPSAYVDYNILSMTSGDIVATLTGYSENITILNNSGSNQHIFTDNGSFLFLYEDDAGNMGATEATVTWIDKQKPTAIVAYSPNTTTTGDVVATLTGYSENITILNNSGSNQYTFIDNGYFVFEYRDNVGNTGESIASVTWIESTGGIYINYSPDNSHITSGDVIAVLTGDNTLVVTNNSGSNTYIFTGNGLFTFEYTYSGGILTGIKNAYVDWIDKEGPTATFTYDPSFNTYGSVVAKIDSFSESGVVILNNSGSDTYIFTGNGSFDFYLRDPYGNTGIATATVDWIKTISVDDIIIARNVTNVGPMQWKTIYFDKIYSSIPYVFATPVSENTLNTYPIPLIRNVSTTGFEITSCVEQGTSVCSTTANSEDFHYFVIDSNDVSSLSWIDVGTVSIPTNGVDTNVSFNKNFINKPYVWTTSQTYSQGGNNGVVAWVDDDTLTTGSMDMIGCLHDGSTDSCALGNNETMAYLAIDVANANITGLSYGKVSISNSTWTNVSFSQSYNDVRVMVSQNSDNGGQDPQYAWARNLSSNGGEVRYCEQDGPGDCDSHVAEDVVWFALDGDVPPFADIVYSTTGLTNQDVIAILTGESEPITIINNNGSRYYTFTGNGVFVYQIKDSTNNVNSVVAEVNWIDKSLPYGKIIYDTDIFREDTINNDGTIENSIVLNLSGDTYSNNVTGLVELYNIPSGLSGIIEYISGTQIKITLTGTALNHLDNDDVNDLGIHFGSGSFVINTVDDVENSIRDDIYVDFYDPFTSISLYPVADTLLDADTDPANGCDDGNCQEANYGALSYIGASDFGSVSLIKFDLSSIPAGSTIYSATLRLTRYDIGEAGTGFKLKKIINNQGWIEGVGDGAGSNADKALEGEPNYKQRKWLQENWSNGNPGFVQGIDYDSSNLIDEDGFLTSGGGDETRTFQLNSAGIQALQSWLDNTGTNQGFAFLDANQDWVIIYSREIRQSSRRPYLSINYNADYISPKLESVSPANGATGVLLDTDLFMTFSEYVYATGSYNVYIKDTSNNIVETIPVVGSQVDSSGSTIQVTLSGTLLANTGYYVLLDSGAFVDIAGNAFTGISDINAWSFVTVDADNAPIVTGVFATGISQNTGTLGGEIISTGSSEIIERGVVWDLIDGFDPANGNLVSETGNWNDVGLFSVPVTGLPAGLWIYYRAFARNSFGIGYSVQDYFLTKPANPIAYEATNVSNHSFLANWSVVTGADSYLLYVATDSGFNNLLPGYSPKIGLVGNSELIENLDTETMYYYKLVSKNDAGYSYESNIISVKTTLLPAPILHLKLEESGGSTAYDSASTHDAILDGTISMQQTGIDNKSFYLDGVDDKLTIVDFGYGPDYTISTWFKKTNTVGTDYLFSHGDDLDSNSTNIVFDGNSNSIKTYVNGALLFELSGSDYTNLLDGEWHLYTLTVDDNYAANDIKKVVLYIDGQPVYVDNTTLSAGPYNPTTNITIGRRSIDSDGTYFEGYIDDILMYNQMLQDTEVKELYDNFVTDMLPPEIVSTIPSSGAIDIDVSNNIEVLFSKEMDQQSIYNTGVFTISPSVSGIVYSWLNDTLRIGHDNLLYDTNYVITIGTGIQDVSGVNMEQPYSFSFTTMKNIFLDYEPVIFVESDTNDGSIKNTMYIRLTGDTFTQDVVSANHVLVYNIPAGLTGVFVRDSDNLLLFSLSGNAVNHTDLDDINDLTIVFDDNAFNTYTAGDVSRSTKADLQIDFNDPNFIALFPVADTSLDINNGTYNYGASTELFVGDGSFMLLKFDLSGLPEGITINSATLTLRKIDGVGDSFQISNMINNVWEEGLKLGSVASDGEVTYNQREHNISNWYGGSVGLISGLDYSGVYLIDNPVFSGNESRIFDLNVNGINILSGWISDSGSNQGFVLYGGNGEMILGASENATESYRPKLLINYTPAPDTTKPTATVDYSPNSGEYISGNVLATLTGFSESGVTITNNGGSPYYTFTGNGSFVFEFVDLAGNTGSVTAIVDWITEGTLSIGSVSDFSFSGDFSSAEISTVIEQQMTGYFYVNDGIGADSGYYTTVSITDLTGTVGVIPAYNVYFKGNNIELSGGTANPNVVFGPLLSGTYINIDSPITYIKRSSGTNNGITGVYRDKPWIKVDVPAYTKAGTYHGVLTYTLYEN